MLKYEVGTAREWYFTKQNIWNLITGVDACHGCKLQRV